MATTLVQLAEIEADKPGGWIRPGRLIDYKTTYQDGWEICLPRRPGRAQEQKKDVAGARRLTRSWARCRTCRRR